MLKNISFEGGGDGGSRGRSVPHVPEQPPISMSGDDQPTFSNHYFVVTEMSGKKLFASL